MNLIEITYPAGTLDAEARAAIAHDIVTALTVTDAAPEATLRRARAMTHVMFHPAQSWTTGNGALPDGQAPPYLVTVTVPEAWREEISRHEIAVIRAAFRRHDRDAGAPRTGGDMWINVVGVADGSIGLDGRPSTAHDVLMHMTEEYRNTATENDPPDLPEGIVIDPICGMHVRLGPTAITVQNAGITLGFCSQGCRDAYAHQHPVLFP